MQELLRGSIWRTFGHNFSVIGYKVQDFWGILGAPEKQLFLEGPGGGQSHHEVGDRYFVGAHGEDNRRGRRSSAIPHAW